MEHYRETLADTVIMLWFTSGDFAEGSAAGILWAPTIPADANILLNMNEVSMTHIYNTYLTPWKINISKVFKPKVNPIMKPYLKAEEDSSSVTFEKPTRWWLETLISN